MGDKPKGTVSTSGLTSEKELQAAVVEVLGWKGWLMYHTHDSRRSQPGFPDLMAVKGGRTMFVELKTEKGRIRSQQKLWLTALANAGCETYLVRPADLDRFIAIVDGDFSTENLRCHWNSVKAAENDMG